jgi:hypothetical protein
MPEKELPQPRNILEAINQNIYLMNENVLTLLRKNEDIEKKLEENQQELIALRLMFNVPEKPNAASGDEGASKESIGSTIKKPSV